MRFGRSFGFVSVSGLSAVLANCNTPGGKGSFPSGKEGCAFFHRGAREPNLGGLTLMTVRLLKCTLFLQPLGDARCCSKPRDQQRKLQGSYTSCRDCHLTQRRCLKSQPSIFFARRMMLQKRWLKCHLSWFWWNANFLAFSMFLAFCF